MKAELTYVPWSVIDEMVDDIAKQVRDSEKEYAYIAGVARGGLIPAVMLSHRLDLPMVAINPNDEVSQHHEVLIIDEIYDTGKTMRKLMENNPRADFAVLYHNIDLAPLKYFAVKRKLDDWIIFPWEKNNEQ